MPVIRLCCFYAATILIPVFPYTTLAPVESPPFPYLLIHTQAPARKPRFVSRGATRGTTATRDTARPLAPSIRSTHASAQTRTMCDLLWEFRVCEKRTCFSVPFFPNVFCLVFFIFILPALRLFFAIPVQLAYFLCKLLYISGISCACAHLSLL